MPDPLNLSPQDRDLMIRTIIGETAASDPSSVAVAQVIANRMRQTGQSAKSIVLAPGQFEPWKSRSQELMNYSPNDPAYKTAAQIVDNVASGKTPDPTNGAKQFYAPVAQKALGRPAPSWDNGSGQTIGAHKFFGGGQSQLSDPFDDFGVNAPATGKSNAPPPSPSSSAKPPAAPLSDPFDDFGVNASGSAPTTPSVDTRFPVHVTSPSVGNAPAPQGVRAGDLDAPVFPANGGTPSVPVNDTVDPYTSLGQQALTAGRNTFNYITNQASGIPNAIRTDFNNSTQLNRFGNQQIQQGDEFPSFPSINPNTWKPGGIVNALAGMAGQVSSPITGLVRKTVQEPVTDATGSPSIGNAADLVANTIAAPLATRLGSASISGATTGLGNAAIGSLAPDVASLANLARTKYGIPVSAMDMAPSNSVMRIGSSALDRLPFSGAGADKAAKMAAWQRGIAAEIGEPGQSALTPDVMSTARVRIGGMFDHVAQNTTLHLDPQFENDIINTVNQADATLTEPEARLIRNQAIQIAQKIDPATRTMDGDTYLALTKHNAPLNSLMNSENSNISNAARSLDDALDSALARSASPQDQQTLATARRQWAALKTIEPLAATSAPIGEISPARLATRVNAQTHNGMAYGWGGNLGELAAIGKRFLVEPGSSNTAERMLTYGAGSAALGDIWRAASGNMSTGEMVKTALGIPVGLTAGRFVNSGLKSNWLANALINRSLQNRGILPPTNGLSSFPAAVGAAGSIPSIVNPPVNALASPNQQ